MILPVAYEVKEVVGGWDAQDSPVLTRPCSGSPC